MHPSSTFPRNRLLSARTPVCLATTSPRRLEISLRNKKELKLLCKRRENFACETILFRKRSSQAIEIIGVRNVRLRGFRAISRVYASFCFALFSPSVFRFADRGLDGRFCFPELLDSTSSILEKAKKGESPSSRRCAVPRNRSSSSAPPPPNLIEPEGSL